MCHLRWISSPLALAFLIGWAGAADTKKDSDTKPQTKDKIESSGKLIGELVSIDANSAKTFKVKVTYLQADPNKYASLQQYIAQKTAEISRERNPASRQNKVAQFQAEVARRQNDVYKKATKDIELEATEEMKVRTKVLPPKSDDKGNTVKYTKKELADLKGPNKSLEGYTAEYDSLHKGQTVKVYLAKKKPKSKTKPKTKDDAEKEGELLKEPPKVTMIVILAESKSEK